ncbi:MAG: hypothetical protein WA364_17715 [Candidatus Nitrosopolaris sp.]
MPKGFKKPEVGMNIHQGGVTSSHVDSKVTQINFTQKGNTNAQGDCPVTFLDMFVTSRCGTNGDSVAGDSTRLYWREGNNLKFGNMEDLFLDCNNSTDKNEFYVLSGYRRKDAEGNKPKNRFSIYTAEIGFSQIKNVMYHGIKPVWKVELRNGKSIEVTKDHSIFCARMGHVNYLVPMALDYLGNVVSVDNYPIISAPLWVSGWVMVHIIIVTNR